MKIYFRQWVQNRILPLAVLMLFLGQSSQSMAQTGEACVNRAITQLGIDLNMEADADLLREILHDEMSLGDFKKLPASLTSSTSLGPLLTSIKRGILERHPAIVDFLCVATQKNLFAGAPEISNRIKRVIHHIYLLETIVSKMSDLSFTLALQEHFRGLKLEHGVSENACGEFCDVLKSTRSLFQSAKLVTVDKKTIAQYIKFRQKKILDQKDLDEKNRGLTLNILEARTADLVRGFEDNATVASVLKAGKVQELRVLGDDRNGSILQRFEGSWASLYETWNLAFVSGNLDDLDAIYPKLIIPQVINADPNEYLYKRGITLWVTTNIVLLRRLNQVPPLPVSPVMRTIAEEWGKVNLKYAEQYVLNLFPGEWIEDFRPSVFWDIYQGARNLGNSFWEAYSILGG